MAHALEGVRRFLLVLAAPVLLVGCSAPQDMKVAEGEIVPFHERLDGGRFEEIYDASAPELKQAASKEAFIAFLAAVHRKLGVVKRVAPKGSRVTIGTSGTFVLLQYETVFDEGTGTEVFTFKVDDTRALLAGYQINSMALVTK